MHAWILFWSWEAETLICSVSMRYPGIHGPFPSFMAQNGCFEGYKWSICTQRRTLVRTHPTGPLLLSEAAMKSKRQESKAVKTLRKTGCHAAHGTTYWKTISKTNPPSCYEPVKAWSQAIKCLKRNTLLATEFPPSTISDISTPALSKRVMTSSPGIRQL